MRYKMGFGGMAFSVGVYIALTLALVVWLYPLLFILSSSISDWLALEQGQVRLLPVGLEFSSYQFIIAQKPMVRAFFNSAFYSASRALLTLALLAPLAYALSERKLRGRNFLTVLLLITMLFGAGMIPMYMVVRWAGLLNTRWAIIIPQLFSFWYVILLRTSFASIPDELKESAYIDGASNWDRIQPHRPCPSRSRSWPRSGSSPACARGTTSSARSYTCRTRSSGRSPSSCATS